MSFVEYVHSWMMKYPRLDVYYHMAYIEQAYKEEKENVKSIKQV